jgi:quinol monooxygenase YgiN
MQHAGMITIGTRIFVKLEMRDAFLEAGRAVAAAVRQESGCIDYHIYEDLETPTEFFFHGKYRDQAAVDHHMGSAHVAAFVAVLPEMSSQDPDGVFADARTA